MEPNTKSPLKIFLIISLAVNVILAALLFILNNNNSDRIAEIEQLNGVVDSKHSEIVSKTQELEDMSGDLARIRSEREKLGLQNDTLDKQINALNDYIAEVKRTSKFDAKKRKELEQMLTTMRLEITKKDEEISNLKSQNDSLATNVSTLTTEKQKLGDSLTHTFKELEYASILKADNIKVTALKENGKEIDEPEYKGHKIDRLKIAFTLADNKAAKKNRKTFYISLVTPTGKVFSDPNNGGGKLRTNEGDEVEYTLNQSVVFDNSNQKLSFTMLKGFNYTAGIYKVEVYSEGYKIGDTKITVK
jgi:predicted RNase H-like nuclease (RuvC/YqgF family)